MCSRVSYSKKKGNCTGPKMEPWGTPQDKRRTVADKDKNSLLERYETNHFTVQKKVPV